MTKKIISSAVLVALVTTTMFTTTITAATQTAESSIDDLSGNLIKFGRFDTQQDIDGLLMEGDPYWTASRDFEYSLNTNPNNTYNNSWGSLKVVQKNSYFSDRQIKLSLRRNQKYHLTGAVKLAKEYTGETKFQIIGVMGNDKYHFFDQKTVTHDQWLVIDETFTPIVTTENGTFKDDINDTESVYENYNLLFRVTRGDDSTAVENLSEFYLDELSLTPVEGNENPTFGSQYQWNTYWWAPKGWGVYARNTDWWGMRAQTAWNNFDAIAEGVADLVEKGEFPNLDRYMTVTDEYNQGTTLPFYQPMAIDNNTLYDVSIWVKSPDETGKFTSVFTPYDTSNPALYTEWGTYVIMGKTKTQANKWTHIKYQMYMDGDGKVKGFDGAIPELRYMTPAADGDGTTAQKSFSIAEYKVEKSKNIISNPYFLMGYSTIRNTDDELSSNAASLANWDHNTGLTGINNAEQTSYDGSKTYAKFTATAENPYVYQTHNISNTKKYKASAWVKLTENADTETKKAAFAIGDQTYGAADVNKTTWTKITLNNFVPNATADTNLGLCLVDDNGDYLTGEFYFTDLTFEEVEEDVVIDSVTLSGTFSDESNLTINVATDNIQPYAGLYKYSIIDADGVKTVVKMGEFGLGEEIPSLAYNSNYGGKSVELTVKPYSMYNTWGSEVTSNQIQIASSETVDATFEYLELTGATENDIIITNEDGAIGSLSGHDTVSVYCVLTSGLNDVATGTVCLAGYDAQDKLVSLKLKEITVAAGQDSNSDTTAKMDISDSTGITKVVVMVWNDSMKPLLASPVVATK